MRIGTWLALAMLAAAFGIAVALPDSRDWFSSQWAAILSKSALDQVGLMCSATGLLGVSTLISGWRAIGKAKQYGELADKQAAECEAEQQSLDSANAELTALKNRDIGDLAFDAVSASSPKAKEQTLARLKANLPQAIRDLANLKSELTPEAATVELHELADKIEASAS